MKKRLRKKLRLQEFQEIGFHVNFEFNYQSSEEIDALTNTIIAFAKANGLYVTGGINFFYVMAEPQRSVTEIKRQLFADWLVQQQGVSDLQVLPLSDAWYIKDREWVDTLPHELVGRPALSR